MFDYTLPQNLIAQEPALPRDNSRLFIYNTAQDKILFDRFKNLHHYLPSDSFLVFNNTKVLPSRVTMQKQNGGKVKALFLVNEVREGNLHNLFIPLLVDRKVMVGDRLFFDKHTSVYIVRQNEKLFTVEYTGTKSDFFHILEQKGTMPIPLYIKQSPLNENELRRKYQTVFAQKKGSSAAPTASLHFTNSVLSSLEHKNISHLFVTLHVGLGTFAPVSEKNMKEKKLHNEYFEIPQSTLSGIKEMKKEGKELVAVGTTVARTLETYGKEENIEKSLVGSTDLFIYPPYKFQMVDHLITNFHLPGSSLMMLVEAFLQHKQAQKHLVELYKVAIEKQFRFYSFGDAMMIL